MKFGLSVAVTDNGQVDGTPGGMDDRGAPATDDSVTWETLLVHEDSRAAEDPDPKPPTRRTFRERTCGRRRKAFASG